MNADGHPQTLVPSHPANAANVRHGAYSPRLREPRAQEIADAIMQEPHTAPIDRLGASEIGRLEAFIETLDEEIARRGIVSRAGNLSALLDLRLRASRRLAEWLDRYGATPKGRAEWARQLAEGEALGATIRRRRASMGPELQMTLGFAWAERRRRAPSVEGGGSPATTVVSTVSPKR